MATTLPTLSPALKTTKDGFPRPLAIGTAVVLFGAIFASLAAAAFAVLPLLK